MGRPSSRPAGEVGGAVGRRVLGEEEALPVTAGLLHDEHGQTPVGERAVGIGPGQQHQDVGPGGEGAPRLDPVDHPSALGRGGRGDDAGDVGAVVRFGHRHGGQDLGRGQLGQPVLLLLFGPAVDQRPGQDLGPGDERAPDAERTPAQLFGGDDHAHVVALAPRRVPVVLLGDRQPEAAQLGQTFDDLFGDVPVGAMHVLGVRPHLLLGEAMERLADQFEVLTQVAGPFDAGQPGQDRRVALGDQEVAHRLEPAALDAPELFAAGHLAGQVGHHVGHEGGGDAGLDVAVGAVLERRPGRGHRGRGVGHVVGDDLVGLDPAVPAHGGAGLIDQFLGQVDGPGGVGQGGRVGRSHGPRRYRLARRASFVQARRPITVTSGGRTTGSSPGSTPVRVSR